MFKTLFRTPVLFDVPDDSGAAPAEPVETVDVGEVTVGEPAVEAPEGSEPEVDPAPAEPVDPYAEWGGREAVEQAVNLDRALQTRAGTQALIEEAGKALYGADPAKAALLQQLLAEADAAPANDPLAEILSDPDRLLSPAEVAQIVDTKVQQAIEKVLGEHVQPLEQRQQAEAAAAVQRSIQTAMSQIEVPAEAQKAVLDFADRYITGDADLHDPAKVTDAIRRGHADWQAEMERQAKVYLEGKKKVVEQHPTTLKGGTAPGGEDAPEPKNEDEAIAAVRAAFGRT